MTRRTIIYKQWDLEEKRLSMLKFLQAVRHVMISDCRTLNCILQVVRHVILADSKTYIIAVCKIRNYCNLYHM